MVLYVMKWDIRNDRRGEYGPWAQGVLNTVLGTGDVAEFRGYRPTSGASEVAVTYEFGDWDAFARWIGNEEVQNAFEGARSYCENMSSEIWGPSPVVPKPIRP